MTDQESGVAIQAIREALADGNAAVMVGAGFSLNANGGHQMATWAALCEELYRGLHPEWTPEPDKQNPFSTAQVLQLGEQYSQVMTQPALEELLKRMVPNDKVEPGALHHKLMRLPWTEVLTTNYDTLLERAAENIVDQGHFTVVCREDIPRSKKAGRRRIVKLHGSFPSNRPFIFTEEEYRRYPEDFAPFVNLVRQSMLENVLCLIGFSGDDPNFLAWIGWVRDMLDKHAQPIYLFLSTPPDVGMRALLKVRKVTPVVLPDAASGEPNDFAGRYAALFSQLAKPLSPGDLEWAANANLGNNESIDYRNESELHKQLIAQSGALHQLTKRYPGWLVAPREVRRDLTTLLARNGTRALLNPSTYENLEKEHTAVAVALLSLHIWCNDVVLNVLHDKIAEVGCRLLEKGPAAFHEAPNDDRATLQSLGASNVGEFRATFRRMGLGLVRWARERQMEADFDNLTERLAAFLPNDAEAIDVIIHERILLHLYHGERILAKTTLLKWRPSATTPYMAVRRGALLAEAGEAAQGFDICVAGLQMLRKSQKVRSDQTRFLSEEAWGCQILDRIVTAIEWENRWLRDEKWRESEDAAMLRKDSRRLARIDGHDVLRHLQELVPDLNADIPLPKEPAHYTTTFDVGNYARSSDRSGGRESSDRMRAAFAWLTAADRIGLFPRIGSSTFEAETFIQAAWWTQYWETPRRLIGVAARLMDTNVLKPRDLSRPVHSTGWLTRDQVARLDRDFAKELRARFINLVDRAMNGFGDEYILEPYITFQLEVAARLSIRVEDDDVLRDAIEWAIKIASTERIAGLSEAWEALAHFVHRNFEASSPEGRRSLLVLIATFPRAPHEIHNRTNWLNPFDLHQWAGTSGQNEETEAAIQNIAVNFLTQVEPNDLDESRDRWLWTWLAALDTFTTLSPDIRSRLQVAAAGHPQWPKGPFYTGYGAAKLSQDKPGERKRFRAWALEMSVPTLRERATVDGKERWSWSFPVNQGFLEPWLTSVSAERWPMSDARKALARVEEWWRKEGRTIIDELGSDRHFDDAIRQRFELIDKCLASTANEGILEKLISTQVVKRWFREFLDRTHERGISLVRTRYSLLGTSPSDAEKAAKALARQFTTAKNDTDPFIAGKLMAEHLSRGRRLGDFVFDTVIASLVTRQTPGLVHSLNICRMALIHTPVDITTARLKLIDASLLDLHSDAIYGPRPRASRLGDEEVPVVRLYATELSIELLKHYPNAKLSGAARWLNEISMDPLPEMRHLVIYKGTTDAGKPRKRKGTSLSSKAISPR